MERVRNCGFGSIASFQPREEERRRCGSRRTCRSRLGACLFLGAGGAGGPGAELRQQAVDGAALLVAASAVVLLTQLGATVPPVIIVILEVSVNRSKDSEFFSSRKWPQPTAVLPLTVLDAVVAGSGAGGPGSPRIALTETSRAHRGPGQEQQQQQQQPAGNGHERKAEAAFRGADTAKVTFSRR